MQRIIYSIRVASKSQVSKPKLEFFNHPEGYVSPLDANDLSKGFKYIYQYKDHLGNVRLSYTDNDNNGVIDASSEIVEESNYYPFGLKHKGYNSNYNPIGNASAQKFGFGGKELQDELNLDWYDVSARNYDPALGRWMNLDPLAEQMRRHSPYNFAFNNPVYFQDYDGMAPVGQEDCCGPGGPMGIGPTLVKVSVSVVKKITSFISKGFFTDDDGGINGISKNGTNQGQKKGGTNTITVNMDNVLAVVPGGPHSKGAANIGKLAKESTTVLKKVKSTAESLKNGMGDTSGAEKVVKTLTTSNTAGESSNKKTDSITAKFLTFEVSGTSENIQYKGNLRDTTVAKGQFNKLLKLQVQKNEEYTRKADSILSSGN